MSALETITVFYTPLASTKLATSLGLAIASHMAVVYTDASGRSFGVSAGPSIHLAIERPAQLLEPVIASTTNKPSGFGVLMADPHNNHAFARSHPEDYYTQDDEGEAYPSALVVSGRNLSATWQRVVAAYAAVDRLHLTYSPISQNSNSLAANALRAAGLKVPFSSATPFVPAAFTRLPLGIEAAATPTTLKPRSAVAP